MNDLEKFSQKITLTLLASQSLFSAAMIMTATVNSIIVVQLAHNNKQWAGVPLTLAVVGAALIAYPMGRFMDRTGRRVGLSLGYLFGITSTLLGGLAIVNQSLPLFLVGVFGFGMTPKGVIDLGRYAAAEASPAHRRARAVSWVVLAGTAGSVVGPGLIDVTSSLASRAAIPTLSGPWFAATLSFGLSLVIIHLFLRPDPQAIGQQLATQERAFPSHQTGGGRPYKEILSDPRAKLATGALIFGQLGMIMVMVITPVHMHSHQHTLASISWVIMAHTLGMFGLSFITGWLVDKLGRAKIILIGGLILTVACLTAPFSNSVPWLALSLFLLGLGWNFCFVAGSTLLSDVLRSEEKGRVQGLTDTMVNIASGVGSASSGLIFAALGFTIMSWLTIVIGLMPVILVILLRPSGQKIALESSHP